MEHLPRPKEIALGAVHAAQFVMERLAGGAWAELAETVNKEKV